MSSPKLDDARLGAPASDKRLFSRRSIVQGLAQAAVWSGVLSACPVPRLLPVRSARADVADMPFTLFDQMHFRNKPNITQYGLSDILVAYADQLWPERQKGAEPDTGFILNHYIPKRTRPPNGILCLDVEHWSLRDEDDRVLQESIRKLKMILGVFRSAWPGVAIGYFGVAPQSDGSFRNHLVDGQATKEDYHAYRVLNDRLRPLMADVDIFFPSLYSKWPNNPAGWEHFARTTLETARAYANGKPVIPFIWPQFWLPGEALIPGPYWRRILDTVYEIADSAVVWSVYSDAPKWDPRWQWWHETVDFLPVNNLAPTVTDRNSL